MLLLDICVHLAVLLLEVDDRLLLLLELLGEHVVLLELALRHLALDLLLLEVRLPLALLRRRLEQVDGSTVFGWQKVSGRSRRYSRPAWTAR